MTNDYRTLTPEEVARTLGTSPWWVREQIRRGRIPHLRFGRGKIRLLPEHVDALVRMVDDRQHGPRLGPATGPTCGPLGTRRHGPVHPRAQAASARPGRRAPAVATERVSRRYRSPCQRIDGLPTSSGPAGDVPPHVHSCCPGDYSWMRYAGAESSCSHWPSPARSKTSSRTS